VFVKAEVRCDAETGFEDVNTSRSLLSRVSLIVIRFRSSLTMQMIAFEYAWWAHRIGRRLVHVTSPGNAVVDIEALV
jgi:hypothetical protein